MNGTSKLFLLCLRHLLLLQVCFLPVAAWALSTGAGGLQRYGNETRVISSNLSGDYHLTKVGTGNLTLTGNNTHTGLTRILQGVLSIGDGGTTGSLGSGAVDNQAALVFNLSSTQTFNNAISGTGSLTQNGSGTLTLAGNNTYSGNTQVNQGILRAGIANNAFGNQSALTLANANGVKLQLNGFNATIGSLAGGGTTGGDIELGANNLTTGDNNGTTTYAGYISGSGNLTKNGTGTMTVSRSDAYSYGSAVGGTRLGNGGTGAGANPALGGGGSANGVGAGGGWRYGSNGGNGFVIVAFYDNTGAVIPDSYAIILTNGSYTVPATATAVEVWAIGGGGGGGASRSTSGSNYSGGGGGAGLAYAFANLNGDTVLDIVIGAGGPHGTSESVAAFQTGGTTTVSFSNVVLTAAGGTGGGGGWKTGRAGTGGAANVTGTTRAQNAYTGGNGTAISYSPNGVGGGSGGGTTAATNRNSIQLVASRINGNTYTGRTTINAGTLLVTHPTSLGWGPITINAGATLNQNGFTILNTIINGGGTIVP